ncbi:uncharacterized protein ACIQIH_000204 [Cyanocitta cristata]
MSPSTTLGTSMTTPVTSTTTQGTTTAPTTLGTSTTSLGTPTTSATTEVTSTTTQVPSTITTTPTTTLGTFTTTLGTSMSPSTTLRTTTTTPVTPTSPTTLGTTTSTQGTPTAPTTTPGTSTSTQGTTTAPTTTPGTTTTTLGTSTTTPVTSMSPSTTLRTTTTPLPTAGTPTAPTTTTPGTTTRAPLGLCENGGTPVGTGCVCTPSYAGTHCEFSTDTIETNLPFPGTIMAALEMEVTLTNFNYSEDLKDPDSDTFRSFRDHFRQEIKKIYGTIPGYEGVEFTSLKSGSIVVGHQVFFTMAQSVNTTEKFQETTEELVEKLRETAASQGDCQHNTSMLCLVLRPNPVVSDMREVSDLEELCRQRAPPGYGDFFFPLITSGVLHCVTNCTPNLPHTLDCHHGRCQVTRGGPQCFCPDEALYWYTGAQCSGRVSKVATGLGVVAAVFFLICVILVVVLLCRRHRSYQSDLPPYFGGSWYEFNDFTWTPPRGAVIPNPGVTPHRDPQPQFGEMDPETWRRPSGPPPCRPPWGSGESPSLQTVLGAGGSLHPAEDPEAEGHPRPVTHPPWDLLEHHEETPTQTRRRPRPKPGAETPKAQARPSPTPQENRDRLPVLPSVSQ